MEDELSLGVYCLTNLSGCGFSSVVGSGGPPRLLWGLVVPLLWAPVWIEIRERGCICGSAGGAGSREGVLSGRVLGWWLYLLLLEQGGLLVFTSE